MCMGGKSKSTAPPPPTPATTFQPMPAADYSNTSQRKQAVAASTNSQVSGQGTSGLGDELGGNGAKAYV